MRSLTLCALDFNCSFSAGGALKTFHTSICIEGHVLDQATLDKFRVRAKLLQTASITAAPAAVVAMVWHVHLYIRMSEILKIAKNERKINTFDNKIKNVWIS